MITLTSTNDYFGFFLSKPLDFSGPLCIITGKNGSGKTRLLNSILSQSSQVTMDGDIIDHQDINLININNPDNEFFSAHSRLELNEVFTRAIMLHLSHLNTHTQLPDSLQIPIPIYESMGKFITVNFKNIITRAENLFGKSFHDLKFEEMQLSICAHNEFFNAIAELNIKDQNQNVSQLVLNYHQSLDLNKILRFYKSDDQGFSAVDSVKLSSIIGEKSPETYLNEIIKKLFRGKFCIASIYNEKAKIAHQPQLCLTSTNQEISLSNLSSGERTIFWLALKTFETLYNSSHQVMHRKRLILIDEPDAYLHPQMIIDFYDCINILQSRLNMTFIFSTHSPTTIALSPTTNIFNIEYDYKSNKFNALKVSKDSAISQLLDGVTQISINPENGRQVYVENENDSRIYSSVFSAIRNKSSKIDPNVLLSFISSGPKIAPSELRKNIKSILGKDSDKVELLVEKINGQGSCEQVIGIVDYLNEGGNRTVRGLIDWDNKDRRTNKHTIIFGKGYAYSIENVIYDPISIFAYCLVKESKPVSHFIVSCEDLHWSEIIQDECKLQIIYDAVTCNILGRESRRDHPVKYMNGATLIGDREYFIPSNNFSGHDFETQVLCKYPEIKKLIPNSNGKPLIYSFITEATLGILSWKFINTVFEDAFIELQF